MKEDIKPLLSEEYIISPTCLPFPSQFDIDTLRLFIHWMNLQDYDYETLKALVNAKEIKKGFKGWYKGFNILISDKGITIIGSFSNYYVGYSNMLLHNDLKNAVERLGVELNLNLHDASLYRVDININFTTDNDVNSYTHHLFTYLSRFKRLEKVDGVTFKTNSKEMICYNKSKEIFEKKGLIVDNRYRIEFRILKNIKKYTGMQKIKDLYEPDNYLKLLAMFRMYYFKIKKQRISDIDFRDLRTGKEYEKHLMLKGIEAKGGDKEVRREIEQLDAQGVFQNRNQKYRLNKKVNDLLNSKSLTSIHPLARELNEKFEEAYNQEKNSKK